MDINGIAGKLRENIGKKREDRNIAKQNGDVGGDCGKRRKKIRTRHL